MAKAKKQKQDEAVEPQSATPQKPAPETPASDLSAAGAKPKSGAKSKKAKPAAKPEPVAAAPLIDPTQAIQAAAAMVGSGHTSPAASANPQKESASFKNLKQSLNKPHSQAIGGLLDKTGNPSGKKNNLPFTGFGKQVGHNQTFGADVSRSACRVGRAGDSGISRDLNHVQFSDQTRIEIDPAFGAAGESFAI